MSVGRRVSLDERLAHILEHPEMAGMQSAIEQTLAHPERIIESLSDSKSRLYYRFYVGTMVGDKFLCIVRGECFDSRFRGRGRIWLVFPEPFQ